MLVASLLLAPSFAAFAQQEAPTVSLTGPATVSAAADGVGSTSFTDAVITRDYESHRSSHFQVLVQDAGGAYRSVTPPAARTRAAAPLSGNVAPNPLTSSAGLPGDVCEIAIDTDFQLFQALGADVDSTVAFVESILHDVDVIFERDTDISIELTTVVVRTSPAQPYTSNEASILLNQVRSQWNGGPLAAAHRDVVHLMTGRNLSGGIINLSFLDVICSPSLGYALTESLFSIDPAERAWVTANALGGNFGATNCFGDPDCGIMCGGAGGCGGSIGAFGSASAATIRANADGYACLQDLAPPLVLPVIESFASDLVDETIWNSSPAEGPSDRGVQPPSPPFAALLTASGATDGLDDRWISNRILAGGAQSIRVSYEAQHRGVPSGQELRVEFIDSVGAWQPLDTVVSDGTDQTIFSPRTAMIPSSGNHDALQIRFTARVDGPAAEWFVDDLAIDAAVQSYCVAGANSVSADGATLSATASSSVSISSNDFELFASSCPSGSFGIYLYSDDRTQSPLGDGFLCVTGSPIFRAAVVQADPFGISSYALDQNALPPGSVIQPGDTVRFQLWYRDSIGAGFNLTNGVEATFEP